MNGTVEEAKQWWCPLARVAAPQDSQWGHTPGNRWWAGDDTLDALQEAIDAIAKAERKP